MGYDEYDRRKYNNFRRIYTHLYTPQTSARRDVETRGLHRRDESVSKRGGKIAVFDL